MNPKNRVNIIRCLLKDILIETAMHIVIENSFFFKWALMTFFPNLISYNKIYGGRSFIIYYWFTMPQILCSKNVFSILGIMGKVLGFHLSFTKFLSDFFDRVLVSSKKVYMTCVLLCFQFCMIKKLFIVHTFSMLYFLELLKYKKAYLGLFLAVNCCWMQELRTPRKKDFYIPNLFWRIGQIWLAGCSGNLC
jgi:hypothetical protein